MSVFSQNPTRLIPAFQAPGRVFGPSPLDAALGRYRTCADQVPGFAWTLSQACVALGKANRVRPEFRSQRQADALKAINVIRQRRRAAIARRDEAAAELVKMGGDPGEYDRQVTAWTTLPAPLDEDRA